MAVENTGGSGNTDPAAVAAAVAAAAAKVTADAAAAKGGEPKTFTQEQLDQIIQERLAKPKKQLEEAQSLISGFQKNQALTDEQQATLNNQINTLQKSLLSKEELTAKEKKELQQQLTEKLTQKEAEAKQWQGMFEKSTIERAIFDQTRDEAFDPNQFIELLAPKTKLIPEVVEGKATGRHLPTISFVGRDADGKSIQMELSVADTVKEMKKMTDKYGNLFKSGLNPGLGGNNAGGTGGKELGDKDITSHDDYMKHRKEIYEARPVGSN